MADVMTPAHPKWNAFCEVLGGPEFCDFTDAGEWRCGGEEHPFAREILGNMGGFDVEASIEYFMAHGGGCDCEILLNVDLEETVH